jgi:PAS domain S-box-containing protein
MPDEQPPKQSYFQSVLARKLILYILLFSSLVTVLGASLQLFLIYKRDLAHLNYVVDQIKTSQLPSVINSVWVADQEEIDIKLQEILSLPDIRYLEIRDADDDKVIASAGEQDSENIISRKYRLSHDFRNREVELGHLYIEATVDGIYRNLLNRICITLLIMGVEIFVVALFIFLVFYLLIGRDLKILADYTSGLDLDHLDRPLNLHRSANGRQRDELDLVASSINKMRASLLREINKLKEAETRIAAGKAEFAAIFNSITDALLFVDQHRRIIMTNPAFTAIFGYQFTEIAGQTAQFLYADPEVFVAQGRTRYNPEAEDQQPVYETDYRRQDGSVFAGETLGVKVRNRGGEVIGFLAIIRNINEKKLLLAEKAALEANLRQAYKMEALGTMAGGIAHDFNNILAIILGNVDFALEDLPVGHPSRYSMEQVLAAANRAKDLVRQILSFSRQKKRQAISLKPQIMVKETLKLLRSTTPATISIIENIDPECRSIKIDPTQFHQLIMNLFTNATYAMAEKGQIEIGLRETVLRPNDFQADERPRPGPYARFSVTDSGIGMERETIERIFDPFYTTKEFGQGTGMGLSVVHGIVERYGGIIRVTSEPGKGSTFDVYFPIVKDEEMIAPSPVTATYPGGSERVLFVDDEKSLGLMGRRILEQLGYRVRVETGSLAALQTFKAAPDSFDLLITDQSMPEMSGLELIAEILKIRADLPVILSTGYSTKVSTENVAKLGISALVMKPYEKKILAETIRRVLA